MKMVPWFDMATYAWWAMKSNGLTMERVFGPFRDEIEARLHCAGS